MGHSRSGVREGAVLVEMFSACSLSDGIFTSETVMEIDCEGEG